MLPYYWTNELKLDYFFSNFLPKGNLINIKATLVAWSRSNVKEEIKNSELNDDSSEGRRDSFAILNFLASFNQIWFTIAFLLF